MAVFQGIMEPIALLMGLMVVGLVLGRWRWWGEEFNRGLSSFVVKVCLPSLILTSMQRPFSSTLAGMGLLAIVVSFAVYGFLFLFAVLGIKLLPFPRDRKGVYRFVLMFSNVGFMGFPLMDALWGRDSVFLGALFNVSFNLLVFTVGIWFLTKDREGERQAGDWILNPGILATLVGFGLFWLPWRLPSLLIHGLDSVGNLTTPLSMLLIGSLLARSSLRQAWKTPNLWGIAVLRLVVVPIALALLLAPWGLPKEIVRLGILVGLLPAAANTSILAAEYGAQAEVASQAVFLTTALSFFTIPVLALLLGIG